MNSDSSEIELKYDKESDTYYIIWRPMFIVASGSTPQYALEELRETAHYAIDSSIETQASTMKGVKDD